jgi:hypothetical protein
MLQVITPATSYDLAAVDAAKIEMEISGTADDAFLARLIRQASDGISGFCGRVFLLETVRETFRLDQYPYATWQWSDMLCPLRVERTPIVEVLSIVEDGQTVDALDYEIDFATGRIWRLAGDLRTGWYGVKIVVEYRGGYALEDVPPELERVCLDMVKRAYYARSRDPAQRSERILDIIDSAWTSTDSAETRGGLPLDIAQRLDGFRRLS